MKKIIIALFVLVFMVGCQDSKKEVDTNKETSSTQQEEQTKQQTEDTKQTEQKEETKSEETKSKESSTPDTSSKQNNNTNKEATPKQESSSSPSTKQPTTPVPEVPATPPVSPPVETKQYVSVSIDCKTILNNMDSFKEQYKSFVPSDGVLLTATKVEYKKGDTVLSLLKRVAKEKGIRVIDQGGYISNIGNINEMGMQNKQGGWMYEVNGTLGNVGANSYTPAANDVIRWRYTCIPGDI